eukprot:scaffold78994_cov49-Attheya_sp.AAC.1
MGTSSFHVGDEKRLEGEIKKSWKTSPVVDTLMDLPPADVKPTYIGEAALERSHSFVQTTPKSLLPMHTQMLEHT